MKLRNKLLIPILIAVLVGFTAFIVVDYVIQNKKAVVETQTEIEKLTELIITANMAYVWNYDSIGLQESLDSFVKNEQIVEIVISDLSDNIIAGASEEGEENLFTEELEMVRDGVTIGNAKIVFTDYYIRKEKSELIKSLIGIVAVIFVIVGVVLWFISGLVIKPVNRLIDIVQDMAEGEANVSVRIPVRGNDELSELSKYFNTFLDKLKTIVMSLKNVGNESKSVSTELTENSQNVSASSKEISYSVKDMTERMEFLNNEIDVCNTSIKQIHSFIARVVDMIQEQAAGVSESSAAIEQMIANVGNIENSTESKFSLVKRLEEKAKILQEGAVQNTKAMEETYQSTEMISEMISVINNVASQTNLLAMNAAIEAAHAGDSGRGFSVVADEIRKLAEQTSSNAKRIRVTLSQVVSGIKEASEMTRNSKEDIAEVIEGVIDLSGGMSETMSGLKEISLGNQQITESLTALTRITEEVRTSGEGMREGTDHINDSISKIAEIIKGNKEGIKDVAGGVGDITNAISMLSQLCDRNSSHIKILDREIAKFST